MDAGHDDATAAEILDRLDRRLWSVLDAREVQSLGDIRCKIRDVGR